MGVDEAGRGPWAGPVVVAAVVLPEVPAEALRQVRDSKLLGAPARERLFKIIRRRALSVSLAWAQPRQIDELNILRATLAAMRRAASRAAAKAAFRTDFGSGASSPMARSAAAGGGKFLVLVDGPFRVPELPHEQEAVVGGDRRSLSIGAASIVAKVIRDRWMRRYARRFPGYGFGRHKGYGTKGHQKALAKLGVCSGHRRSYEPVSQRLLALG